MTGVQTCALPICQNLINKYANDYANELKKNKEIYKQDSGKFKEFNKEYKKKIMKEYKEKSNGDESIEFKEIIKKEIEQENEKIQFKNRDTGKLYSL